MNIVKKNVKIALLLILAISCFVEGQAQSRKIIYLQNYDKAPYHFGFLLGANFMDYNLILKEDYNNPDNKHFESNELPTYIPYRTGDFESYQIIKVEREAGSMLRQIPRVGFSIGVIGDLRILDRLNLRFSPTFSLSEINYQYTLKINYLDGTSETIRSEDTRSHNPYLSCVEFPLHFKYKSKRYNNIAAYMIAGANSKLYFSFKKQSQSVDWIVPNAFDLAMEVGSGFDIYNQWFKVGVEFKFAYGLLNAMSNNQVFYYAQPLNGFKNKQFQLSLTFE